MNKKAFLGTETFELMYLSVLRDIFGQHTNAYWDLDKSALEHLISLEAFWNQNNSQWFLLSMCKDSSRNPLRICWPEIVS